MSSGIIRATIIASVLTATSNVLAQAITSYRSKSPLYINWAPVFQFALYTFVTCPPNYVWQQFVESVFPGQTLQPSNSAIAAAGLNDEKELDKEEASNQILENKLNIPNTIIKVLIDQSLCASVNTIAFSLVMASLQGANAEQAIQITKQEFWPILKAGWRLWPTVSLLSYAFVKTVKTRTLVGNLAGMVWNIYLSMLTGK